MAPERRRAPSATAPRVSSLVRPLCYSPQVDHGPLEQVQLHNQAQAGAQQHELGGRGLRRGRARARARARVIINSNCHAA